MKILFKTLFILSLTICLTFFFQCSSFPRSFKKKKILLTACYEGTMNSNRIYLFEDSSYYSNSVGLLGFQINYKGTFYRANDTLYITATQNKSKEITHTKMIVDNKNQQLIHFYYTGDSIHFSMVHYFGPCRGEN